MCVCACVRAPVYGCVLRVCVCARVPIYVCACVRAWRQPSGTNISNHANHALKYDVMIKIIHTNVRIYINSHTHVYIAM